MNLEIDFKQHHTAWSQQSLREFMMNMYPRNVIIIFVNLNLVLYSVFLQPFSESQVGNTAKALMKNSV